MAQDAASEFHRRAMMGIPAAAGTMSRASFHDGVGPVAPLQYDRRALMDRFGPIIGGALKPKIAELDEQESNLFIPPPRTAVNFDRPANVEGEYHDKSGGKAAIVPNMGMGLPRTDRRNQRARGPQQQTQKVSKSDYIVPVVDPTAGIGGIKQGPEAAELAQINAMFGGGSYSSGGYRSNGPLMAERGRDTSISLGDDYIASAPYNPASQIMSRAAARGAGPTVDYREIEARRNPAPEIHDDGNDRYLSNTSQRGQQRQDPQLIQEMALTMATEMFKTMMEEQKGKKYFKEVRTKHVFDNPASKLIEMDGQFYRMDLKPVKLKYPKK